MIEYSSDGKKQICKTQIWNFDFLIENIRRQEKEYFNKYHMFPKYIKMPYGLPSALAGEFLVFEHDKICYCCGLIICETLSVKTLEEIEVF